MQNLLIVESPTKARTIGKYLGKDFKVLATVGHIRDLPGNKMGVDLKGDFDVDYVIDPKKKEVINDLLTAAKEANRIILATDPDREGEAISWHVKWILENNKKMSNDKGQMTNKKIIRITFHEITKEAVVEALKQAREIDMDLVNAQQGRRILDRVVGYSLSPVLWKKVRRGLSAGRVQSVAVRLIVEREKEINKFSQEKFYKIFGQIAKNKNNFIAELSKVEGKSVVKTEKLKLLDGDYSFSKTIFKDKKEVDKFVAGLSKEFKVDDIKENEIHRTPLPSFTTSKLQQAAARRMGWSGKQTMSLAQKLYEKGMITYHRTDSVYLSDKAIADFRDYISKKYGSEYVAGKVRIYKNNSKNAQEAHEAIRPTDVSLAPEEGAAFAERFSEPRERKLYEMIWRRAVATQAAASKMKNTTLLLSNGKGLFQSKGVIMLFDGFLKISGEKHEDQLLPEVKKGEILPSIRIWEEELLTNPPPRYTDASLVASLERQGIGRPSTYAPIISTIQARQYVEKDEGKFKPTSLGAATNEFLVNNFENIMSLPFTAEMEEDLDEIAQGKMEWKVMMKKFYKTFKKEIDKAEKDSERVRVEAEKMGEKCPECKEGELVIRLGRFGKFISCDRFPDCKYTAPYKESAGFVCPECGGEGVIKKTRTGRKFFGCANYPNCKWAGWKKPEEKAAK